MAHRPGEGGSEQRPKDSTIDDIAERFEDKVRRFESTTGIKVPHHEDSILPPEALSAAEAEDALKVLAMRDKLQAEEFATKTEAMEVEAQAYRDLWEKDAEQAKARKERNARMDKMLQDMQEAIIDAQIVDRVHQETRSDPENDMKTVPPPRRQRPSQQA